MAAASCFFGPIGRESRRRAVQKSQQKPSRIALSTAVAAPPTTTSTNTCSEVVGLAGGRRPLINHERSPRMIVTNLVALDLALRGNPNELTCFGSKMLNDVIEIGIEIGNGNEFGRATQRF